MLSTINGSLRFDNMAKWKVGNGMDKYTDNLRDLLGASDEMLGRAIYPGAGIIADAMNSAIDSIPPAKYRYVQGVKVVKGITDIQRAGLHEGLGIATMRRTDGFLNVKVGFSGYNEKGQPNPMIAATCEAGSTYRERTAFISRAVNSAKGAAESAIAEEFDKQLQKYSD